MLISGWNLSLALHPPPFHVSFRTRANYGCHRMGFFFHKFFIQFFDSGDQVTIKKGYNTSNFFLKTNWLRPCTYNGIQTIKVNTYSKILLWYSIITLTQSANVSLSLSIKCISFIWQFPCTIWNMDGVIESDSVSALICCKGTFVNLQKINNNVKWQWELRKEKYIFYSEQN